MNLIRQILLAAEDCTEVVIPESALFELKTDEWTEDKIRYHCFLIVDGGFAYGRPVLDALSIHGGQFREIHAVAQQTLLHLSWEGHELAQTIRDEGVWNKVRAAIARTVNTTSVGVMAELAKHFTKQTLGL